jgi:predicted Zn finger-like uncharacterized protein
MIITCPNCKKKFNIDPTLINNEGRDLKCGSCDHVWHYKVEDVNSTALTLNENIDNSQIEPYENKTENDEIVKNNETISKNLTHKKQGKPNNLSLDKKKNIGSKFFSYLVVFFISLIALVILLDTLKTPLINTFPSLEVILFNLFETLKDIKLFIIDLY